MPCPTTTATESTDPGTSSTSFDVPPPFAVRSIVPAVHGVGPLRQAAVVGSPMRGPKTADQNAIPRATKTVASAPSRRGDSRTRL
jgi:hypothetical protein